MKTTRAILAALAAFAIPAANAGTGWNTNDGGSLQFLDPANWDDGDVNGVFPAEWTGPDAALSLRLTNDWTGALTFLGNIAKDTTFYGRKDDDSGAQNRTITLDGDILVQPSASAGKLSFDATVGFDLGGETRSFLCYSPSKADNFRVSGPIANGNLILGGNGAGMTLVGNAAIGGDVEVRPNTTLVVNWAPANGSNVRRTEKLELNRSTFSVNAYRNPDTSTIGRLVVSGQDVAGVSILSLSHANNCLGTLQSDSLDIRDEGSLVILSADLGAASDATAGNRLLFVEAPTLVGGIVPFVFDDTATTQSGYKGNNNLLAYGALRFTTYDTENGLHALNAEDMATAISDEEDVNLYVRAATISIDSESSVNAICLDATEWNDSAAISGEAPLHVKSGQILASSSNGGMTIGVPVVLGSVQGCVTAMGWPHRAVNITKPFSGTAGLILTKAMPTSYDMTQAPNSGAAGFAISGADIVDQGSYTGDTYIQCIVNVNSTPFLPHGARSGNTIVNGCLSFGTIAINGLYGTGAVRGTSLTVGEDGSDSDFDGSAYLTSALNVAGGAFRLDGTVAQGAVNVAAGATIGGSGGITNNLVFAEGAKLAVEVVDGAAPCLTVAGAVSGGKWTVDATVSGGKWTQPQCVLSSGSSMAGVTFAKGTNVGSLELRNEGTELWAGPVLAQPTIISMH